MKVVRAGDALENLALAADQAEPAEPGPDGVQPPGAPGAPAPESPNRGAICFALAAFREIACRMLGAESPHKTLADPIIERCADALAPVADKYGLNMGGMFAGPEALALMTAGPLLWEAASQLNLELKAKRAKPVDQTEPAPAPAP